MKKLLPHPVLSALIAAGWLLLAGLTAGQVALAVLVGLAMPVVARRFFEEPLGGARNWRAVPLAARFIVLVTWDIVVANVVVARLVLGPPARLRPAFVEVPIALEHPLAIALLGSIITMTPGTVSSDLSDDRRRILVHVLDTDDPAALVARIKSRYEHPLSEIFS